MVWNLVQETFISIIQLLGSPFQDKSLLWQLTPILLVWSFMTFYFGTHKKERLGWNTALGNGISLFWIIISALQYIFSNELEEFTFTKFYLIAIVTLYAVMIIYVSFKHTFSDKLTYSLASPTPIYFFSTIVLLYAHNLFELTIPMILAIVILFISVMLIVKFIEILLPEMKEETDDNLDFKNNDFEKGFKDDDFKMNEKEPQFNDFEKGFSETGDFKPATNKMEEINRTFPVENQQPINNPASNIRTYNNFQRM